jgi:hypothetical protein
MTSKTKPEKDLAPAAIADAEKRCKSQSDRYRNAMRDVYERMDKLAREISLDNLAKLDKVAVAHAHRTVAEMKALWRAATGGAPLPPEIGAAIEAYVADVRTHTAPLADAARHEQSARAAGLPTPLGREVERRKLVRKSQAALALSRRTGKQSSQAREDPARDKQRQEMITRADQLRAEGVRDVVQKLKERGLCKKIGADDPNEDLSDRQIRRIINEPKKKDRNSRKK